MNNPYYQELVKAREETAGELGSLPEIPAPQSLRDSVGELSVNDNHPADLGSENYERAKDISLGENKKWKLSRIQKALDKMEMGQFGWCERCEKKIEEERLRAIPYAENCYWCAREEEKKSLDNRRPLEELSMAPPYALSFKDGEDYAAFDGEDAWQEVSRYNRQEKVYYEDLGPGEEGPGEGEDLENMPVSKGEDGSYYKNPVPRDKQ